MGRVRLRVWGSIVFFCFFFAFFWRSLKGLITGLKCPVSFAAVRKVPVVFPETIQSRVFGTQKTSLFGYVGPCGGTESEVQSSGGV